MLKFDSKNTFSQNLSVWYRIFSEGFPIGYKKALKWYVGKLKLGVLI